MVSTRITAPPLPTTPRRKRFWAWAPRDSTCFLDEVRADLDGHADLQNMHDVCMSGHATTPCLGELGNAPHLQNAFLSSWPCAEPPMM
eukprot:3773393-Amphidinium_carterae.1